MIIVKMEIRGGKNELDSNNNYRNYLHHTSDAVKE